MVVLSLFDLWDATGSSSIVNRLKMKLAKKSGCLSTPTRAGIVFRQDGAESKGG